MRFKIASHFLRCSTSQETLYESFVCMCVWCVRVCFCVCARESLTISLSLSLCMFLCVCVCVHFPLFCCHLFPPRQCGECNMRLIYFFRAYFGDILGWYYLFACMSLSMSISYIYLCACVCVRESMCAGVFVCVCRCVCVSDMWECSMCLDSISGVVWQCRAGHLFCGTITHT